MSDEMKATLFLISWFVVYMLSIINARLDVLGWVTLIYFGIVVASARLEKAEERLKLYKDDADRRGRELMSESEPEEIHEQHITMTKGKSA